MTSFAAGRADLNAKTGGPGEASVSDSSVSTGEKPGDSEQDQQMVPVSQILTVAGTGDCNADISYYKKEKPDCQEQKRNHIENVLSISSTGRDCR